ncbi:NADP-dependent oxidoreductase domain-containing protein [Massariosphaeria phaeospora]|uniref:NADP-dependent oxidoreductase domain-containing protein n=1 Tax=Massariosphaeria phaeospora TaxID=100035 RepID=A0A7C8I5S2_9PLEO|nr:NADP-dependent oxidoreductase domain-containing protein [Massariosphaeria phaeospora]
MSPNTKLDVVFGAMTFGKEGQAQVRTSKLSDASAILDILQKHGHKEVDTSRFYGDGSSEEYLAALKYQDRALIMDTKFYPNTQGYFGRPVTHLDLPSMRQGLAESLTALQADSIDLWYLHAPDRSTPLEETLRAVAALSKEGRFQRWGISNYTAWEVAAMCEICNQNAWAKPAVYQGVYNALFRTVENELLACLHKYDIAFYAFNPLAGGVLTHRYRRDTADAAIEPGSRFDPAQMQGKMYRVRYWTGETFDALEALRGAAGKYGLRESECALRWMMHHSALKRELGDKVIIGASSGEQLEMNLKDLEGGELPADVVAALDKGWEGCRAKAWKYFH